MGLICRTGDSPRAKLFTVLALCLLAFGIYAGINRSDYLPSAHTPQAAVLLGGLVALVASYAFLCDDNPIAPINRDRPFLKALATPCIAIGFFGIGWMATYGLAAAAMQFAAPTFEEKATVQTVYPQHRGKGCSYKLQIQASSSPIELSPCVSDKLWRNSKPGDTVQIVFASNLLGVQFIDMTAMD